MTGIKGMAVSVATDGDDATNLAIAWTVLGAIRDALGELVAAGTSSVIDLRALPRMEAATYRVLTDTLAAGEVTAVVAAGVTVEVRETGYPGVWWLTHRNENGAVVTEFIEITLIPEILKPHAAELRTGLQRLAQLLSDRPSDTPRNGVEHD